MHEQACPFCAFPVEKSFLRCPSCLKRLKEPCANCRKPLDPRWKLCPYCEAEVGQAPQPQRRRRRAAPERGRPATVERTAPERAGAERQQAARAAPRAEPGGAQQPTPPATEPGTAVRPPSDGGEPAPRQPTPRPSAG
jgi:hypothetical protein